MIDEERNIDIQQALRELYKIQGSVVSGQESLAKDIRKNDERSKEQMEAIKAEFNERLSKIEEQFEDKPDTMKGKLNGLMEKAKYWKWALCVMIGACMIVASVVEFGNELVAFLRSISSLKGDRQ